MQFFFKEKGQINITVTLVAFVWWWLIWYDTALCLAVEVLEFQKPLISWLTTVCYERVRICSCSSSDGGEMRHLKDKRWRWVVFWRQDSTAPLELKVCFMMKINSPVTASILEMQSFCHFHKRNLYSTRLVKAVFSLFRSTCSVTMVTHYITAIHLWV